MQAHAAGRCATHLGLLVKDGGAALPRLDRKHSHAPGPQRLGKDPGERKTQYVGRGVVYKRRVGCDAPVIGHITSGSFFFRNTDPLRSLGMVPLASDGLAINTIREGVLASNTGSRRWVSSKGP